MNLTQTVHHFHADWQGPENTSANINLPKASRYQEPCYRQRWFWTYLCRAVRDQQDGKSSKWCLTHTSHSNSWHYLQTVMSGVLQPFDFILHEYIDPDRKVHGANMGPSVADRTQMGGPMLAPWTLLSWDLICISVDVTLHKLWSIVYPYVSLVSFYCRIVQHSSWTSFYH